ncbi:MAG: DegT/DnrJ/EryC1/StrS family aminotransferase [Acidobacteriaceae bacterium]
MLAAPRPKLMVFNSWPQFDEEEICAVTEVLKSRQVNYWTGEQGRLFESEYAESLGIGHAVALCNGTAALELALLALGIGPGDEVITSSRTFIASASCAVRVGAKPVVADVDPVSQNITAKQCGRH